MTCGTGACEQNGIVPDSCMPPPSTLTKGVKMAGKSVGKHTHKVHLEITRLESHAIFRKCISLDDVDRFATLKSQTYQWHGFIALLFKGLGGPVRDVMMRTSCQSRFLCDVIERSNTPILSCCHLAAFTVPHETVSGRSCGPAESGI